MVCELCLNKAVFKNTLPMRVLGGNMAEEKFL
jgi:hypothetical protein